MATNYQRGADAERRLVNKARKEGEIAFRSAGSHSPIDVTIINPELKRIMFIQRKAVKEPIYKKNGELRSKYKEYEKYFNLLKGEFKVEFKII